MPIWNNEKDNVLMVEMGFGDVAVQTGKKPDAEYDDELVITPRNGREHDDMIGKTTREVGSAVRIVFHNRNSVAVVMCQLQEIYDGYPAPAPKPSAADGPKTLPPSDWHKYYCLYVLGHAEDCSMLCPCWEWDGGGRKKLIKPPKPSAAEGECEGCDGTGFVDVGEAWEGEEPCPYGCKPAASGEAGA